MTSSRWQVLGLLVWLLPPGGAMAQDVAGAIRAGRWAEAEARAESPLAVKLVTYFRLQAAGQAAAAEIGTFAADNPDWPWQGALERRRQEALGREASETVLAAECARKPIDLALALLRCAEAAARAGRDEEAAQYARRAWVMGDITETGAEEAFLRRWGKMLRPADQWARFDAIIADSAIAATRQIPRIAPERRALARARLGFRQSGSDAAGLLAAVPAEQRDDPALFLAQVRDLREQENVEAAMAQWRERGARVQAEADAARREEFWAERHLFARRRLRAGDAEGAYLLAARHGALKTETLVDAQFLAGFIALRFLHDPTRAREHFQALADISRAAITQGRAQYWLGRTAATGNGGDAATYFSRAAAWPLTFYGQLAAAELGEKSSAIAARISAVRDPEGRVASVDGSELARATKILVGWGENKRALPFLIRLDEMTANPTGRAGLALFALELGMPEAAVAIGRRMGRDGLMLPNAGWPAAAEPPGKPIAIPVSLALIRQESAFETAARSRAGALGLMQLMPRTAQTVAQRLGETTSPALLVADPAHNMRLGTAYLRQMEEQFGSLPLALAVYNAGPHRVTAWLAANGDPRNGAVELLDWLELIPFNETRNYVQRVLENVAIYRARLGASENLLAEWRK